jgi:hypothetical protein
MTTAAACLTVAAALGLIRYGVCLLLDWVETNRAVDRAIGSLDDPSDGFDHHLDRHTTCPVPGCVTCALTREGAR